MVSAGESSGSLPDLLERLAKLLERQAEMRGKLISALAYPIVLTCVAILVVAALMIAVVPKVVAQFRRRRPATASAYAHHHRHQHVPRRLLVGPAAVDRGRGSRRSLCAKERSLPSSFRSVPDVLSCFTSSTLVLLAVRRGRMAAEHRPGRPVRTRPREHPHGEEVTQEEGPQEEQGQPRQASQQLTLSARQRRWPGPAPRRAPGVAVCGLRSRCAARRGRPRCDAAPWRAGRPAPGRSSSA